MLNQDDPIVIVSAVRSPMGAFQGGLTPLSSPEIAAFTVKEAVSRATIAPIMIDEVYMGCVLPAGLGQAPARQAALKGGLPESVPCTTINKMCGSGLKAIMMGIDSLVAGTNDIVLCGGMESMTNAPYLLPKARGGFRMGHGDVKDHMFLDGLEDAYDKGKLMGCFADDTAKDGNITREDQDNWALQSLSRAQKAQKDGLFKQEITPITIETRKGTMTIDEDETPKNARPDKIPTLRPAFGKDGTVTAANASSISDGAASVILTRESIAKKHNMPILAKVHGHSSFARKPSEFCLAPVGAMEKLFTQTGWTREDVDVYEINEAFAVVTLAAINALDLDPETVNIHGGACALGHPIGATGARFMATLIYALKNTGKTKGIASLCIGGGEATAIAIEVV